jgi:hypothetical protein
VPFQLITIFVQFHCWCLSAGVEAASAPWISTDAMQGVLKAMPCLKSLDIYQGRAGHDVQALSAVPLPSLHTLHICAVNLSRAQLPQGYTQLKELSLTYTNLKGVGAAAQLTGLTKLELCSLALGCQLFSASEQSELGSTLAALRNLKCLHIDHAPPGPVAEALSQLTALTELSFSNQGRVLDPAPLALPSVLCLSFGTGKVTVQQLLCFDAPHLQQLKVCELGIHPADLPDLRRLGRGLLTACNCLSLKHKCNLSAAWSKEDTVALMTVLHQDWQPSAEALRPSSSSSIQPQDSNSSTPLEWRLEVLPTHCCRQSLSLLPKGLNWLQLMWVTWTVVALSLKPQSVLRYQAVLP